jgi:agmatine deiminase
LSYIGGVSSAGVSPRDAGFHMPAETAKHAATWVAWPSHGDLWLENLAPARAAFTRLVECIAEGERAEVLVADAEQEGLARAALPTTGVRFHRVPFGDIWLRDTAPIFLVGEGGREAATVRFLFNGWGGKYLLDHDDQVAERIVGLVGERAAKARAFALPFVLEGGAVEVDGEGSVLTTRQCLLNRNRNPAMNAAAIEAGLLGALGCEKVLWLGEGLLNDHTDGHVDTVMRFARPGVLVAMEARDEADPNRDILKALLRDAGRLTDARGRRLEVVRVPSPGRIEDPDGRVMPASYVNYYVTNTAVAVPTYGSPFDDEAVERIGALYPGRRAVGIDCRAILSGGGALHCITQQEPQGGAS